MPPVPAFLVGCGWGALLGAINGVLVTRFKINALIATLATLSIYRGGLQLVSGAGVTNIGNGFTVFGQTQILGIYSPFWFMAVIVLLFAFLVGRTRYFRQAYYIGGNARAAKLSGINVDRTVFSFFVIMGLLAGLAGALLASRLNTAVVLAGKASSSRSSPPSCSAAPAFPAASARSSARSSACSSWRFCRTP